MKKIFWLLCIVYASFSMDRPPRLNPKQTESDYVKKATSMTQGVVFREMLNKGMPFTYEDLEALATEQNQHRHSYFWRTFGIDFLIKAVLSPDGLEQLKSLRYLAAKKVGKESAISKLPRELKSLVIAGNPKRIQQELENLLDVAVSQKSSQDPNIIATKLELVQELWTAVLEHETIPYALTILTEVRQAFEKVKKPEPFIITTMIDQLVNVICKNMILITSYLRSNNLLDPLAKRVAEAFDAEISKALNNELESKLRSDKDLLIKLLNATSVTCPTFVKTIVKEITEKQRNVEMSTWQTLRHAFF